MKPQGLSVASVSWLLGTTGGWGARGVVRAILLIHTHHWFFWVVGEGKKRWTFEDGRCCEETLVLCFFFLVFVGGFWMDREDRVDGSPTVDGRNPANQLIW